MLARAALFLALVLLPSATAHATTGGPILAEILGVDAEGKVYWLESRQDESGIVPQLFYLAPGASAPVAVRSWYRRGVPDDDLDAFEARRARLAARLAPLPRLPRAAIRLERTVVSRSWHRVSRDLPPVRELHVVVALRAPDGAERRTEVIAYQRAGVRIVSAHALPDGRSLVVLTYRGVPVEGTYERQSVAIVPDRAAPPL